MKKAETIISHLLKKPTFQNAAKAECLELLITHALPKNLSRFVSFCYIKNDSLFIAITHPGVKMELYYKGNLLKSILVMLKKTNPKCQMLAFSDIKVFTTNKIDREVDENTVPRYYEHSQAAFENLAVDEKLHAQFEQIRAQIKQQIP